MKTPLPTSKFLCCASVLALTLAGCSHNSDQHKSTLNVADNGNESTGKFVKLKKGHRTNRLTGKFPDPRSYDNLWDRLLDRFDLPEVSHQDIDREMNWFINHPTYIERVQSRAEPFLYSIVKQLEKNNMPAELALLPVIESAFQPHAVSPAHAAGIWQFIPATGRHYGLKQSYSYDGRRDIYASTKAAIKYLKKLRNDFNGDWLLAIAGYNCGEGAVARAIQRNQARGLPTDFWSLDLPRETRSYVPRLLAVAKLFSDAETYGINLRPIPNKPLYKTVVLKDQVDLALAANAADMSLDKLFELNPGFKRQQVDVNGSYRLFIPAHKKIAEFKEELARQVAAQQPGSPGSYHSYVDQGSYSPPPSDLNGKFYDGNTRSAPPVSEPSRLESSPPPEESGAGMASPPVEKSSAEETPAPTLAEQAMPAAELPAQEPSVQEPAAQLASYQPETANAAVAEAEPVKPKSRKIHYSTAPNPSLDAPPAPADAIAPIYASDSATVASYGVSAYENENIAAEVREEKAAKVSRKAARREMASLPVAPPPMKETAKAVERVVAAPLPERPERAFAPRMAGKPVKTRLEPMVERRAAEPAPELPIKRAAYTVKEGDTLYSIARRHDMDVEDLKKLNKVSDADDIKWGQNIKVAGREVVEKPAPVGKSGNGKASAKYTPKDGDTLFSISKRFNVTVADLRKWNGIKTDKQFRSGSNIHVSGDRN